MGTGTRKGERLPLPPRRLRPTLSRVRSPLQDLDRRSPPSQHSRLRDPRVIATKEDQDQDQVQEQEQDLDLASTSSPPRRSLRTRPTRTLPPPLPPPTQPQAPSPPPPHPNPNPYTYAISTPNGNAGTNAPNSYTYSHYPPHLASTTDRGTDREWGSRTVVFGLNES